MIFYYAICKEFYYQKGPNGINCEGQTCDEYVKIYAVDPKDMQSNIGMTIFTKSKTVLRIIHLKPIYEAVHWNLTFECNSNDPESIHLSLDDRVNCRGCKAEAYKVDDGLICEILVNHYKFFSGSNMAFYKNNITVNDIIIDQDFPTYHYQHFLSGLPVEKFGNDDMLAFIVFKSSYLSIAVAAIKESVSTLNLIIDYEYQESSTSFYIRFLYSCGMENGYPTGNSEYFVQRNVEDDDDEVRVHRYPTKLTHMDVLKITNPYSSKEFCCKFDHPLNYKITGISSIGYVDFNRTKIRHFQSTLDGRLIHLVFEA